MRSGRAVRALKLALLAGAACGAGHDALAQRVRDPSAVPLPQGVGGGRGAGLSSGITAGSGVNAYIEVRERVSFGNGGGSNGGLSTVFDLGGSAGLQRERISAGASGNLQYSLSNTGGGRNRFSVNGIARILVEPIEDTLTLTGTAFGGLVNGRFGNSVLIDSIDQNNNDLRQFYSLDGSANFRRDIAERLRFTASYQYSYSDVGNRGQSGGGGGGNNNFGGAISDSTSQFANASIGLIPNIYRLTVTASGSYTLNEQDLLEQRFKSYSGNVDLSYAVNPKLALLGSGGYQDYNSTRQAISFAPDFLLANIDGSIPLTRDAADPNRLFFSGAPVVLQDFYRLAGFPFTFDLPDGDNFVLNEAARSQGLDNFSVLSPNGAPPFGLVPVGFSPVLDANGQFVPDPTAPRDTLYRQSGLVWNAGFRYTPSRRLSGDIRVGQRFQSVTVTGSLNYQVRRNTTVSAQLSDGIETFGTIATRIINGIPVSVAAGQGQGRGASFLGGCIIGPDPRAPFGCIDGEIQSVSSGVFRSRIGSLSVSTGQARSRLIVRATYNQRNFLDRNQSVGPGGVPIDPTLAGRSDTSYNLSAIYDRTLDQQQTITGQLGGGYFDQQLRGGSQSYFIRSTVRYNRRFTDRLTAVASASASQRFGSNNADQDLGGFFGGASGRDRTNVSLSAGVRYQF